MGPHLDRAGVDTWPNYSAMQPSPTISWECSPSPDHLAQVMPRSASSVQSPTLEAMRFEVGSAVAPGKSGSGCLLVVRTR
jgi:hypothetical protein